MAHDLREARSMKTRNPITTPTLTVAQLIHDLVVSPMPEDTFQRLEAAFAKLSAAEPSPQMRATYTADMARIRKLHHALVHDETASERSIARAALRTLGDDYRNVAQDNPADDAAQDEVLSAVVARAALERSLAGNLQKH